MLGTRYEEYVSYSKLPFILHIDIDRTPYNCSKEKNWHEDIEIELCTGGSGTVLLNGEKYEFKENDIIAIGSDVIHYTTTKSRLTYTCLIISAQFCRQMDIDCSKMQFTPLIKSEKLISLLKSLTKAYTDNSLPCRTAKLNELVLKILIELVSSHSTSVSLPTAESRALKNVKATIRFIRENYNRKITLDEIAKTLYTDKYALCREFKKSAGQTIIEYANSYRCQKAADYITEGYTVTQAASLCGFENLSFFTKTFKKYMGKLPKYYK